MIIIGDIHGKYEQYYSIASQEKSSIQLGDFGFEEAWTKLGYSNLNPELHKVGPGNHDPHNIIENHPFFLGRYGQKIVDNIDFFWIGGALSIDMVYRVGAWMNGAARTWYSNEQLNYHEMMACQTQYTLIRPRILLSHACPAHIIDLLGGNKKPNIMHQYGWGANYHDMTSQFLDFLYTLHTPEIHIFGHHHVSFHEVINGTEFICLPELGVTFL